MIRMPKEGLPNHHSQTGEGPVHYCESRETYHTSHES